MKHETHTPGPWTIDGNHFQIWANDGGNAVASVYSTTAPEPMASEARANARLIASAPDLLAALEQCQTFVSAYIKAGQSRADMAGMPGPYAIDTAIKSAIARATGAEGEGAK